MYYNRVLDFRQRKLQFEEEQINNVIEQIRSNSVEYKLIRQNTNSDSLDQPASDLTSPPGLDKMLGNSKSVPFGARKGFVTPGAAPSLQTMISNKKIKSLGRLEEINENENDDSESGNRRERLQKAAEQSTFVKEHHISKQ